MANPEHVKILKEGVESWNKWRIENPGIEPDLSELDFTENNLITVNLIKINFDKTNLYKVILKGVEIFHAQLRKACLIEADLSDTNLIGTNLVYAKLNNAKLCNANLTDAKLYRANLDNADLFDATLQNADFRAAILTNAKLNHATLLGANFSSADLSGAKMIDADCEQANFTDSKLIGADLTESYLKLATFVRTNLTNAKLIDSSVYGISAWDMKLDHSIQKNLFISTDDQPKITVDNIEVAQFIYLLLNNEKIRDVIDTITSKVVLILGRFTAERIRILDVIREELRKHNYSPILFDFEKPATRDVTETISTLAHMSRFVVADITDARSIPQELKAIVPNLPSVPIAVLLERDSDEYGMFEHIARYPWVLPKFRYDKLDDIIESINPKIITPAEAKAIELQNSYGKERTFFPW